MKEILPEIRAYFSERLRSMGITDQMNSFESKTYATVEGELVETPEKTEIIQFFSLTEKGIGINYFDRTGQQFTFHKGNAKMPIKFIRTRLHKEKTFANEGKVQIQKYEQQKDSPSFPFFTPGIIKAWQEKRKLKTLFLIEGEFKAFKADLELSKLEEFKESGFIGIPGIHGFYSSNVNARAEINEFIQHIILDLEVQNISFLLDADTLTVKYADGKDLFLRPKSFSSAVKNFRDSLNLLINDDQCKLKNVYFQHLKSKFNDTAKGLDDLLILTPAKAKSIFEDLHSFAFAKEFFQGIIISDGQEDTIKRHFGVANKENFYKIYSDFIGSRPFVFNKSKYQWTGEQLEYVKSEEAELFMRVGIDWMKRIKVPNHRAIIEEQVIKWSVAEIQRDYPKHIAEMLVKRDIPKYDSFYVEPNWSPKDYRRVLHNCYNLVEPLMWDLKPGRFDTTLKFLKHLFQGEGTIEWDDESQAYKENNIKGDQFTVAIDYLTIIHQYPKQKTFVPCLVSRDQRTGKSTFLEWLCMVYSGNGTILDNERFKMNFNSHYASKFIIGLDEGFLDVEKKAERERLKKMVTSKTMFLENKGVNVKEIPYHGKLIICSNDADNLMKMEAEDTRWFVVKVPGIDKKDVDVDLDKKMMDEIPYYLHYITNRQIHHEKVDRLWFATEDFVTDQMKKIVEITKARLDATVENFIKDMFLTYKVEEVKINRKKLLSLLNNPEISKYKIDDKELKYFIEEKKGYKYQNPARCKIPIGLREINGHLITDFYEEIQRHYLFKPEEWLNPEEYSEYKKIFNVDTQEQAGTGNNPGNSFPEAGQLDSKQYKIEEALRKKSKDNPF